MIKTLKNTTKEIYNWTKDKVVRFKNWLILIIFGAVVVAAPLVIPPEISDIALENIQAKYEASDIKNKYRLEKTAFILDAIDENAIQAEVGNKDLSEFTPELTLRKWDDEVSFKVKYKHNVKKDKQKVDIENLKIKWKGEKTEVHYYDIKKGELLHDKVLEADSFEVEVVLLSKPDTNIVGFDIETTGLAFYYQPELTQEEKDEGHIRPENVVGSYAVYHESKQGDYSKMGLKNYRAGKAFHIYRPKIIDSAGTEVWGKLNITNNLLTVEIPQEFLDNAVYPVRHAAGLTFGYETGGSGAYGIDDIIRGNVYASGVVGTGDNIKMHAGSIAQNDPVKMALYLDSDESFVAGTDEVTINVGTVARDWFAANFTSPPNILAATDYWIVGWAGSGVYLSYDEVAVDYAADSEVYNGWPATLVPGSNNGYRFSIYCTYTAGGAARRMFLVE